MEVNIDSNEVQDQQEEVEHERIASAAAADAAKRRHLKNKFGP
jgi:hypothetical protein